MSGARYCAGASKKRKQNLLVRDPETIGLREKVTELLPARKLLEISALRGTGNGESEERLTQRGHGSSIIRNRAALSRTRANARTRTRP